MKAIAASMTALAGLLAIPAFAAATRAPVDPARVVEAADVCLKAPSGREQTLDAARAKGFRDLPAEERSGFAMEQFVPLERDGVWLRAKGPGGFGNSGGNCEVTAPVPAGATQQDVETLLARQIGKAGEVKHYATGDERSWTVDGRHLSVRVAGGDATVFMAFPERSDAEIAAERAAAAKGEAEQRARILAATRFAQPAEFGAAAASCMAALRNGSLDAAALAGDGWVRSAEEPKIPVFERQGSSVRLFVIDGLMPGGQCVVDGYVANAGHYRPVRDAVRASLTQRAGKKPEMPSSPVPRSQGFLVDNVMLILSTEERFNGLSVRITSGRIG